MSNIVLQIMTSTLLIAHVIALITAGMISRSVAPLLWLNLVIALGVTGYFIFHPRLLTGVDGPMLCFGLAEVFACALAVFGLRDVRIAIAPSCAVFAVHFLMSGAATAFAFFFEMKRLI